MTEVEILIHLVGLGVASVILGLPALIHAVRLMRREREEQRTGLRKEMAKCTQAVGNEGLYVVELVGAGRHARRCITFRVEWLKPTHTGRRMAGSVKAAGDA